MNKNYNVIGIGNAIVDISCLVEDQFLIDHNLTKGSMFLIDEGNANKLSHLKYQKISSGGSIANAVATLAMLGAETALIGKVGNDKFGNIFFDELSQVSCDFYCQNKEKSGSTAKSFILITPDGERTMCTYLGLASKIADEINKKLITSADILFLEGYLWDEPETIAAMRQAIEFVVEDDNCSTKIAFTLSDAFCVDRHRADFLDLFLHLDILFANQLEMTLLLGEDFSQNDYQKVKEAIKQRNPNLIIAMTSSENGATIFEGDKNIYQVPTTKIDNVIDATGAGDAFSAGFLYGFSKNLSLKKCAEFGNLLAGKVIQKLGARLDKSEISSLNN